MGGRSSSQMACGWMVLLSRSAAATAVPNRPEASDDLDLFSFYASQYLAETRTAAYLWAKNHSEEACQLLADSVCIVLLPTPPASAISGTPDVEEWLKQLRDQAKAARSAISAAMDWLDADRSNTCPGRPSEQQARLTQLAAGLMPALPRVRRAANQRIGPASPVRIEIGKRGCQM